MSRTRLVSTLVGATLLAVLLLLLVVRHDSGSQNAPPDSTDPGAPSAPGDSSSRVDEPSLPILADASERQPSEPEPTESEPTESEPEAEELEDVLGEPDLIAALRALDLAQRTEDIAELQRLLESLLADPAIVESLLQLLRDEALREEPEATRGAMIALETALVIYGRHEGVDPRAARALVCSVLHALAELPRPERALVIERLVAAEFAGRPIVDARFLRDVLDLRIAWPELRSELTPLLENLGRGFEGEGGAELFYSVLASEQDDPLAVTLALSALLESGSETFLLLAEQMFRETQDPALRRAVVVAIVTSLPVGRAAERFTELAGPNSWAEAHSLGAREGGTAALLDAYERDLATGAHHAQGRRMLVRGMLEASPQALLDIARADPDGAVRGEAWNALTARGETDAATMAELAETIRAWSPQDAFGAAVVVGATGNVLASGAPSARAAARGLLIELAADASLEGWLRRTAAQTLEQHAPGSLPEELRPLLEGG